MVAERINPLSGYQFSEKDISHPDFGKIKQIYINTGFEIKDDFSQVYLDACSEKKAKDAAASEKALYESIIQSYMDQAAKERGYENILSACTYAADENPYQEEGKAYVQWRGKCWQAAYVIMNDYLNGNRDKPTEAELISELPELVLP